LYASEPFLYHRYLCKLTLFGQNAKKAEIENARPSKDSPANDRFKALVADQKAIREQQMANKSSRTSQLEKYTAAENQVKQLIQDQKNQRAKMPFKNVEEIDAQIDHLNKQVDSGKMKLVDEKKALDEVSKLRKQRKGFSALDDLQKRIDEKKAENAELKKTFDTQESRALSQRYESNQKELDEIKAARDGTNKNLDAIKAEREKLNNEQKTTWAKIKEIKDTYYQNKKAYKEYEDMLYQQRRDKQRAEREAYEKEKRKRIAEETLQKASDRAYMDEIRSAESLLAFFDPSARTSDSTREPRKFAAEAQRTVDESGLKGMKVMKKEEEDFFVGSGGKKKGKGKKTAGDGTSSTTKSGKFNLDPGTIEGLSGLGIDPPASQGEVPAVIEKLREKVDFFKKDQDRKTKEVRLLYEDAYQ
jgi:chromosome segregation ATPase